MADNPAQAREIRRLVDEEGLSEEKARELATEQQFDVVVDGDGVALTPAPQPD